MDFDDFVEEFETSLEQEIDSVRSEYSVMFDLVEKLTPHIENILEIDKLKHYDKAVNKSINIVEKFVKEVNGIWDYSFEDFVKNAIEEDPDLEKDDISIEWYYNDMQFIIDDYFENTANQDLVKSVQDAKEWEWQEYEFDRKFKKYVEDLHTISNNLINCFQKVKHDSVISIFEE